MAKSILIVDDDIDIRETVAEILQDEGYLVSAAANGAEALFRLRTTPQLPRLILLDLGMPVMNGMEFRVAQLQEPDLAAIPVVIITAAGDAVEKDRALAPAAVVRKPFRLEALIETVQRYC